MIHAALLLVILAAQSPASSPCDRDPAFHRLDFWIGRWNVYDRTDGSLSGTSAITKALKG